MRKYVIVGLAEACSLCLPDDGRKAANKPVFQVVSEGGGFSGAVCSQHVALLLKMDDPAKPQPAKAAEPRPTPAALAAQPVPPAALPAGNGQK